MQSLACVCMNTSSLHRGLIPLGVRLSCFLSFADVSFLTFTFSNTIPSPANDLGQPGTGYIVLPKTGRTAATTVSDLPHASSRFTSQIGYTTAPPSADWAAQHEACIASGFAPNDSPEDPVFCRIGQWLVDASVFLWIQLFMMHSSKKKKKKSQVAGASEKYNKRQAQLSELCAASLSMGPSVLLLEPQPSLRTLNASWKPQALLLFLSLVDHTEPQEGSFVLFWTTSGWLFLAKCAV